MVSNLCPPNPSIPGCLYLKVSQIMEYTQLDAEVARSRSHRWTRFGFGAIVATTLLVAVIVVAMIAQGNDTAYVTSDEDGSSIKSQSDQLDTTESSTDQHQLARLQGIDDWEEKLEALVSGFGHALAAGAQKIAQVVRQTVTAAMKAAFHWLAAAMNLLDFAVGVTFQPVLDNIKKFCQAFQPWLVQFNDNIFGDQLGPILAKVEAAQIVRVMPLGTIGKVIAQGQDLVDEMHSLAKCSKQQDFDCTGQSIVRMLQTVDSVMNDQFSSMLGVVTGLAKAEGIMANGITLAQAAQHDLPVIARSLDAVADGAPPAQLLQACVDLGTALGDFSVVVGGVDPKVAAVWDRVAAHFQQEIAVGHAAGTLFVFGTDVLAELREARTCFQSRDFGCVGTQVQLLIRQVAAVLPQQFDATKQLAAQLSQADHAIGGVAVPCVHVYKQLEVVAQDVHGQWFRPPNLKQALKDLASVLSTMQPVVTELNQDAGGQLQLAVIAMSSAVATVNTLHTTVCAGVDVGYDLKQVADCWKQQHWLCAARGSKKLVDDIGSASPHFSALQNVTEALARVGSVPALALDAVKTWTSLDDALMATLPPTDTERVQQGVKTLGEALQLMQESLNDLDSALGHRVSAVSSTLRDEVAQVQVVQGQVQALTVKGVQILTPLLKLQSCWASQDYDCAGDQLNALIDLFT